MNQIKTNAFVLDRSLELDSRRALGYSYGDRLAGAETVWKQLRILTVKKSISKKGKTG